MYVLANTTVSILRGTAASAFGDVEDAPTVIQSGLIAQIVQMPSSSSRPFTPGVRVSEPGAPAPRIVRHFSCTLPFGTDITESDQILDELSGTIFEIVEVTNSLWEALQPDLQLVLKRVTSNLPV